MNYSPTLADQAMSAVGRNGKNIRSAVEKMIDQYKAACFKSKSSHKPTAEAFEIIAAARRRRLEELIKGRTNPVEMCKGR